MMDKEHIGYDALTIDELRERLEDAEKLIEAIRAGEVDAFAVNHDNQHKVFTLQSADYAYRILIENFSEGAVNITEDGLIVYCNNYFHEMLGVSYDSVVGNYIYDYIHPDFVEEFHALFCKALGGQSKGEILLTGSSRSIPVYASLTSLYPHTPTVGMIVSNLTEKRKFDRDTSEKNKFIETILDASPDLILVMDRDLRCISFNNKAISEFNFDHHKEGLGKYIVDIMPDLDRRTITALKNALIGKEKCIGERDVFNDGRFFDNHIVPLRNDREEIYAVMMTLRNVSEHAKNKQRLRRTNIKLQERNNLIETIIEASHELIAVYDTDLTLLTMNNASEISTGWSKEKLIGKKLSQFYPGAAGSKAESDLKKALNGEFVSNEPFYSKVTGCTLRNYITPLRDNTGQVYAALAIAQDVTDIVKSQEALQKTQAHFALLFRMSPVAKTIIRLADGIIVNVNPAWEKMFRRKYNDVIGKTLPAIGLQARSLSAPKGLENLLVDDTMIGNDVEYMVAPGKNIFTYTASVQFEMDGEPHLLSATIDTTQRRKDEERIKASIEQLAEQNETLARINAELASFSYVASHDLQEPLRKIQTFCHRIMEKDADSFSPLTKSYFDRITNAAFRMQKLISALLDYSRTNPEASDFIPTDLNVTFSEVRTNLREMIIENKVSLRVGELPVVEVMPLQIAQLFSNLLINSIKYQREGIRPEINVSAREVKASEISPDLTSPDDLFCEIHVQDNGIGFDQQHVEKIFGLFQRLHGKSEYEGTGIGLAICKKIIDNHKGYIKAIGTPGEGATFLIYLPMHRKHDETQKDFADR